MRTLATDAVDFLGDGLEPDSLVGLEGAKAVVAVLVAERAAVVDDVAVARVIEDVRNGLVSVEGARLDYGVVISDRKTLAVDEAATAKLRAA